MRGSNNICDSDLWQGTAKAAEGHLAHLLFTKAKEEGMNVALNWQDQDSSSGLSFRSIFPDGDLNRIMLCGGHVGRSHAKNVKEHKTTKTVTVGFKNKHKADFPKIEELECICKGKKHFKGCGCLTDSFILAAKRNHFSALKQSGKNPAEYARRMKILGKYHCRDIHTWVNERGKKEECGFHQLVVCSCGECVKKKVANKEREDVGVHGGSECEGARDSGGSDSENGNEKCDENSASEEMRDNENSNVECDKDSEEMSDSGGSDSENGNVECDKSSEEMRDSGDSDSENGNVECDKDATIDNEGSDDDESSEDSSDSDDSDCDVLKCSGKPYSTRQVLKCPLHALLYEIECNRVARKANEVIHVEMGRGHSNLPESKFNVLTRFRPKSVNLHQLHYECATNIGLCQSNMTYMYRKNGPEYHWMGELLQKMGLPIPDGIQDIWTADNKRRMNALRKQQTDKAKTARAKRKQKRFIESKERQKFNRRQKIVHSYGDFDEDVGELDESNVLAEVQSQIDNNEQGFPDVPHCQPPKGARVTIGGRCRCGSTDHKRISHKSCPLNKKKQKSSKE